MSDALSPHELEKSDIKQVQKAKQDAGTREAQEKQDMHELMHNAAFRRFLWHTLGLTGMNANETDFNNVNRQYYLKGRAAVGKDVSEFVQGYQPEQYLVMIKENMEKEA